MFPLTLVKSLALIAICFTTGALVYDWWSCLPPDAEASYVGTDQCIRCHQSQTRDWEGSHHDLAMDVAKEQTVRGDFNEASIEHFGITSVMYRDGDRFMARTEGADGSMADFEITHVFGYEPLQQYLVQTQAPTPGTENALGTLQVLPLCWDTERKRWFYLSPPDVDEKLEPDDPLHWTRYAQNWNHMCAACHSTNLQKNYDVESTSFATKFTDMDVGCEACHGPGSLHVQLASAKSLFWDRRVGKAVTKFSDLQPENEYRTCGPCHSRRRNVFPDNATQGDNFFDHYAVSTIQPRLYYPDGQIRDEVYVLGSYMQSKMFAKGVRCSACHDPHSTRVKYDDNRLCTSCHQHPAAKYDNPAHHQHLVGSPGATCVECHMPATPYMMIDLRRDHSMKIPRPDRSVTLGVPNACTGCHLDRERIPEELRPELNYYADWLKLADRGEAPVKAELNRVNQWMADMTRRWYGDAEEDDIYAFAETFAAAWKDPQAAATQLPTLTDLATSRELPAMVRASALEVINSVSAFDSATLSKTSRLLRDRDPFVRATAASLLGSRLTAELIPELVPLLFDAVRHVRVEAALALASVPARQLTSDQREARTQALDEYRQNLRYHGDQAGSHLALGLLAERTGHDRQAIDHYLDAIKVQPLVTGPRSNLANVLERRGAPESAAKARAEELPLLARDANLAPDNAQVQYRYAMALYLQQRFDEAEAVLLEALHHNPSFATGRYFLALLYDKLGRPEEALQQARELLRQVPGEPRYGALLRQLSAE